MYNRFFWVQRLEKQLAFESDRMFWPKTITLAPGKLLAQCKSGIPQGNQQTD